MIDVDKMGESLGMDVALHKEVLKAIDRAFRSTVGKQRNRPGQMAYFDNVLHESHGGRVAELLEGKERGEKIIGTFCIYVPDEIAYALDLIPIALCGGTSFSIPYAEKLFPRNICPLVKSTLGLAFSKTCPYAPIKSLAVGETTCDAKKKTWDYLAEKIPFHIMEVPQKKNAADAALWKGEVAEFSRRLEALSGKPLTPERLSRGIRIMNAKRRSLQRLNEFRRLGPPPISGLDALVVMQAALNDDPVRFTRQCEELNSELQDRARRQVSPFPSGVRRIMVSGCPSVMGNWKIQALIEQAGAAVVCDETCTGTRYFRDLVDEIDGTVEGMLEAVADRYFRIDCSCFSPNKERMENILRLAREVKADGVVQYILLYCHGYNVEAVKAASTLKKAGIPSLKIETDYSEEDTGQIRLRVEAFLEGLENHAKS